MRATLRLSLLLSLWALVAHAAGPAVPVDPLDEWRNTNDRSNDGPLSDFRLINYFFSRFSATNLLGDPVGLRGVSLGPIGLGAGSSVQATPTSFNAYFEQRWIPVIEYTPSFADDLAAFRAQFEVDFTWGLGANAVQQNSGGGFNADMVNLQTKNLNVSLYPTRKPRQLSIVIGTQSFYDSIYDPARTSILEIVKGGYKLSYLGSDGTGISVFTEPISGLRFRAALMFIGASQPDKAALDDPHLAFSYLTMLDASYETRPGTTVGLSGWMLRDDTKGKAYAFEGLVLSGPSSTGLNTFTGTARLPIEAAIGTVGFIGAHFEHNLSFNTGRFAASGFAMLNVGRYWSTNDPANIKTLDILGGTGNVELLYQYGRNPNELLTLEGLYSTGDSDLGDNKYTGAYTMNFYGLPGAVWFNHKTLLLFPFTSTVNNYSGAVTDVSNQGLGVSTAIATASYDLVPNTLNFKVGTAVAAANASPAGSTNSRFMGFEINAELKYTIRYLMTVGLHGAYMVKGGFYDGNPRVTANPYAFFTTFTWYAF